MSYKRIAKEVRTCEDCREAGKGYHVHHKDRNKKNNSPENLKALCPRCHFREHAQERADNYEPGAYSDLTRIISSRSLIGQRLTSGFEMLEMDE